MRKKGTKNKNYSAEFKISVIMDMRKNHLGYCETVRKYGLGSTQSGGAINTLHRWERIYLEEGATGLMTERRGRKSTGRPRKKPLDTLISKWNSWMDILLYISKTEEGRRFWTVQYYLRYLREAVGAANSAVGSEQVLSASIVVTVLPVCILFPFLQKNFANGISLGAVKG